MATDDNITTGPWLNDNGPKARTRLAHKKGMKNGVTQIELQNVERDLKAEFRRKVSLEAKRMRYRLKKEGMSTEAIAAKVKKEIAEFKSNLTISNYSPLQAMRYVLSLRMFNKEYSDAMDVAQILIRYTHSPAPQQINTDINNTSDLCEEEIAERIVQLSMEIGNIND